ncbi:unnamed protein product [marine sediment metagenome]|uniref:Nucleoside 2-deoxyribosyltransferase n=1 Tax=marine sediment metagenome TaxID=412755 RepID=X1SQZ7_9ZZZZ
MEVPDIHEKSLEDIEKNLPDYSVSKKQLILMRNIREKTKYPGELVELSPNDFPLAWAENYEEFIYYINSLVERGLLFKRKISSIQVKITADGWDYLDERAKIPSESNQVFVAMSFSKDMDSVYDNAIAPAIEKAGYKPHRMDREPHNKQIDMKIMADIKDSKFVVTDFTQQKHGVYFEAGYALGLGLPVLWCVKKKDLDDAHFDTRQYNHIAWESEKDLKEQLYNFICAIVGKQERA